MDLPRADNLRRGRAERVPPRIIKIFRELQAPIGQHGDKVFQDSFALLERHRHEPHAVEMEQVEAPEAQCRRLVAEIHQRAKTRQAILVAGNELAVEDGALCPELIDRRAEGAEQSGNVGSVLAIEIQRRAELEHLFQGREAWAVVLGGTGTIPTPAIW